jgi:hypothetical protein
MYFIRERRTAEKHMASPNNAIHQTADNIPEGSGYSDPWFRPDVEDLSPHDREWVIWRFPQQLLKASH